MGGLPAAGEEGEQVGRVGWVWDGGGVGWGWDGGGVGVRWDGGAVGVGWGPCDGLVGFYGGEKQVRSGGGGGVRGETTGREADEDKRAQGRVSGVWRPTTTRMEAGRGACLKHL